MVSGQSEEKVTITAQTEELQSYPAIQALPRPAHHRGRQLCSPEMSSALIKLHLSIPHAKRGHEHSGAEQRGRGRGLGWGA